MKKLFIISKDGLKATYTMKNCVDYRPYLDRYPRELIHSAILQQYPKKDNKPVILVQNKEGESHAKGSTDK